MIWRFQLIQEEGRVVSNTRGNWDVGVKTRECRATCTPSHHQGDHMDTQNHEYKYLNPQGLMEYRKHRFLKHLPFWGSSSLFPTHHIIRFASRHATIHCKDFNVYLLSRVYNSLVLKATEGK